MIKIPNGFTPTFAAGDIAPVATDIVVGTGAAIVPFAPLIGTAAALKATQRIAQGKKKKRGRTATTRKKSTTKKKRGGKKRLPSLGQMLGLKPRRRKSTKRKKR